MGSRLGSVLLAVSVALAVLACFLSVAFVALKVWNQRWERRAQVAMGRLAAARTRDEFLALARRFPVEAERVLALRLKQGDAAAKELFDALGGMERIRTLAASSRPDRRIRAAELLGHLPVSTESSRTLCQLVADPRPLVREAAVRAVAFRGDAAAAAAMLRTIEEYQDLGLYLLARRALRACGPAVVGALVAGLGSPLPEVRWLCLEALGDLGAPESLPVLLDLATPDRDVETLTRAARALRRFRGPEVVVRLLELATHPAWEVRAQVARSLGWVAGGWENLAPEQERAVDSIREAVVERLQQLACDPEYWVRNNAVIALTALGSRGKEALRALAKGPDRYAADRAREALERPGEPASGMAGSSGSAG
ncbi:MAG: HEAT repeat domain-containing protein [Firmicutes bacterium]|nr:HEAT repeat domain-containing protein [Bacillota bacterium]